MSERVRIERLAAGGDGVGRLPDGRVVFVPRTAPGDLVTLADVRLHARFARARIGGLLEPGPARVTPRCPHYETDACGGCQLQHLEAQTQRETRRRIAGDALRRIGKLPMDDPPLEAGPTEWGYRTKLTLAVAPEGGAAGFHRWDDPDRIFSLVRCEIADERLNRLWAAVSGVAGRWPPAVRHIVLRVARDGTLGLGFEGPVRPAPELTEALAHRLAPVGIWWEPPGQPARPVAGDTGAASAPGVFEQVHPSVGDQVRRFAVDALGPVEGQLVWDLYAGIGETTAMLAARGARVESVELNPAAVAVAMGALPSSGVRCRAGRVEARIHQLDHPFAVVTNPPRAGMDPGAVSAMVAAQPERVVYCSCDPATLARDLRRMGSGYRVAAVQAFDLFPQTAHVETVVGLTRA